MNAELHLGISTLQKSMLKEASELLNWWEANMIDHNRGGFYARRDAQNRLDINAPKGIILNTRILWTFSAAARTLKESEYEKIAQRAFEYLMEHFWDQKYGGFYWSLSPRGSVMDSKKQIYAQAFGIYALSEYYLLTGNTDAKECSLQLFELIEAHAHDPQKGGYLEAFNQQWRALSDVRLSSKDLNAEKTMNTHLHILEAYTNLSRAVPDQKIELALSQLLYLFEEKFLSRDFHLHLFFDKNWQLLSNEISFGHDIEASWLMCEAAEQLKEPELFQHFNRLAVKICKGTYQKGLDLDGSVFNEGLGAKIIDTDKHWWPQAEAIIGFINAYQISNEEKYLVAAQKTWSFIEKYLKDPVHGEWHWRLDAQNQLIHTEDKAGPWKAPYHNVRMCLELYKRLETL